MSVDYCHTVIPYDPLDPSPCERCHLLAEWSARQWEKLQKNKKEENKTNEKVSGSVIGVDG